jgi:hypothetical protein
MKHKGKNMLETRHKKTGTKIPVCQSKFSARI